MYSELMGGREIPPEMLRQVGPWPKNSPNEHDHLGRQLVCMLLLHTDCQDLADPEKIAEMSREEKEELLEKLNKRLGIRRLKR